MEPSSNACKKCKKKTIIRDECGGLVCTSCGTVQDFDDYQHHFNGQNDALGTFVRIGSASHKGDFNYKDYKLYQAALKIEEVTSRLGLSSSTTAKVKQTMEQITQGDLGDACIFAGTQYASLCFWELKAWTRLDQYSFNCSFVMTTVVEVWTFAHIRLHSMGVNIAETPVLGTVLL